MLDFEQLAFIEKWRQRATRGVVVALDGRESGDILITVRVGELGERLDLRGRDVTGAVRKQRLGIGDRITIALEYTARDVGPGMDRAVAGGVIAPGAVVEGLITAKGDLSIVDCGASILVNGASLGTAGLNDIVRFTVADEGKAYLIPTR